MKLGMISIDELISFNGASMCNHEEGKNTRGNLLINQPETYTHKNVQDMDLFTISKITVGR